MIRRDITQRPARRARLCPGVASRTVAAHRGGCSMGDAHAAPARAAAGLEAIYHGETEDLLRRRLAITAVLYLASVGCLMPIEWVWYPERRAELLELAAAHAAAFALALAAWRLPGTRQRPRTFAVAVSVALVLSVTWYHVLVGLSVERLAMALACGLSGLVVLLPWGFGPQLLVALCSMVAIEVADRLGLGRTDSALYSEVGLATVAVTTVLGAFFLERHRREAFVSSAQHAEEAGIAAALLRIGEALNAHRDHDEMLERVNALCVEALGCDWSSTLARPPHGEAFRLRGNIGMAPDLPAGA